MSVCVRRTVRHKQIINVDSYRLTRYIITQTKFELRTHDQLLFRENSRIGIILKERSFKVIYEETVKDMYIL
ncbi:MAG: hypothetical protein ACE5GV_04825 [Candidatus Scalindua sp.]